MRRTARVSLRTHKRAHAHATGSVRACAPDSTGSASCQIACLCTLYAEVIPGQEPGVTRTCTPRGYVWGGTGVRLCVTPITDDRGVTFLIRVGLGDTLNDMM